MASFFVQYYSDTSVGSDCNICGCVPFVETEWQVECKNNYNETDEQLTGGYSRIRVESSVACRTSPGLEWKS